MSVFIRWSSVIKKKKLFVTPSLSQRENGGEGDGTEAAARQAPASCSPAAPPRALASRWARGIDPSRQRRSRIVPKADHIPT